VKGPGSEAVPPSASLDWRKRRGVGPASADAVAERLALGPEGTATLLNALAALGLLRSSRGVYSLTDAAARWLRPGEPGYLGDLYRHQERMWQLWSWLGDALRQEPAGEQDPRQAEEEFVLAMEANARRSGPPVAAAVDLGGVRRLLDLGGGPGTWARFFLERRPGLEITIFDRAEVNRVARRLGLDGGHCGAITRRSGDFLRREIGRGYDLVWVSHVVHSLDPDGVRTLLGRCRRALVPGGRLMLHDFFLDRAGIHPRRAAVMSVHMLAVTGSGRCYTRRDMCRMLEEGGFTGVRRAAGFPATALLEGRRP
jgi:SAM-dependent methyltransferase